MIQVPDEIKELLHLDTCKKNIRIHFPNGERSDICNDLIVKDSVSFKESLCSQDTLKFGLCEASVFECETVGVGNIKGATIEVTCEIYCDSEVEDAVWQMDLQAWVYGIPYGTFVVDTCKRQADMNHRKIVAYGGTKNIRTDNEIVNAKARSGWSSATNYSPDIFATLLMMTNATAPLSRANMVELTTEDVEITFVSRPSLIGQANFLTCNCIAYTITSSNHDNLYYFSGENAYKTFDEIANDLYPEGQGIIPRKYLEQIFLFGTGQSGLLGNASLQQGYLSNVATQKGSYIYPYQTIQYANSLESKIFVPYKVNINTRLTGEETVVVSSSEFRDKTKIHLYRVDYSEYPQVRFTVKRTLDDNDELYRFSEDSIDYINLFNGTLELSGLYATLDRFNQLKLINIKQQFGLVPSYDLYPDEDLYPEGVTGGKLLPNDYQSCWYDDEYMKPFGAVVCNYKNTGNNDRIFTYYFGGFNANSQIDSYQVYTLTGNNVIANGTWTKAQIRSFCELIAENIEGVTYMPVEFVGRGLPYVEAGDTFEILTKSNDSITTIVLNRTLTGELTLTDSYKSV